VVVIVQNQALTLQIFMLNLSLQKCHEILRVIAIPNVVVILSDKKT
jgi:hypothetical protein